MPDRVPFSPKMLEGADWETLNSLAAKFKGEAADEELKAAAEPLAQLAWIDVQHLRNIGKGNPTLQAAVAPYEHRAYAREEVRKDPRKAALYAAMIPAYQAAKALGIGSDEETTPASLNQVMQGYIGIGEGLKGAAEDVVGKVKSWMR